MFYTVFSTPLGWMALAGSSNGLRQSVLPQPSAHDAEVLIRDTAATFNESFFGDLLQKIIKYMSGEPVIFHEVLDISDANPFYRDVWLATCQIPYGETRSYKWLASKAGYPGAARAVGQAMARNRIPIIIPCHRVITSQGQLGGFRGGLDMKRQLLGLEGIDHRTN